MIEVESLTRERWRDMLWPAVRSEYITVMSRSMIHHAKEQKKKATNLDGTLRGYSWAGGFSADWGDRGWSGVAE